MTSSGLQRTLFLNHRHHKEHPSRSTPTTPPVLLHNLCRVFQSSVDVVFLQAQEAILSDGLDEMEDILNDDHDATIETYADFGKIFLSMERVVICCIFLIGSFWWWKILQQEVSISSYQSIFPMFQLLEIPLPHWKAASMDIHHHHNPEFHWRPNGIERIQGSKGLLNK